MSFEHVDKKKEVEEEDEDGKNDQNEIIYMKFSLTEKVNRTKRKTIYILHINVCFTNVSA